MLIGSKRDGSQSNTRTKKKKVMYMIQYICVDNTTSVGVYSACNVIFVMNIE